MCLSLAPGYSRCRTERCKTVATPKSSKVDSTQGSDDSLSIYFAGDLWNHKDLIGNAILAQYIETVSRNRYTCVVPQNLEQATRRAVNIRNQDLGRVLTCDLAIFNFDGTELDSGTVIEFLFAKMLDVPCVILRSDIRAGGDSDKDGDAWNLMCSSYPRSRVYEFNSMARYQEAAFAGGTMDEVIERLYSQIASELVKELDAVRLEAPVCQQNNEVLSHVYRWATQFPGGGLEKCFSKRKIEAVLKGKKAKGLL